jgi:hypothetical protein
MPGTRLRLALTLALLTFPARAWAEEPVSFRNEVMAVLSRAGCNQGACHGNQNGKGGFRLSLRGQIPAFDHDSITRDMSGRRANRARPADSLILLKATASLPHEGGKRFRKNSLEYALLERWIAGGLQRDVEQATRVVRIDVEPREQVLVEPADHVKLKVTAHFADGRSRDVTSLTTFETSNLKAIVDPDGTASKLGDGETTILVRYLERQTTVRLAFEPARPGFVWQPVHEPNFIDRNVYARLKLLRMQPSELCSDSVFLRRAYLDAIGILPTPDEVRRFLADTRLDRRSRLIDALLARPEFADFWALKWSDLLRNEEKALDPKGVRLFHDWIRRAIAEGRPLNEFARELVSGRGSTYSNPAANYYRALRDPQTRAEATAQVFLGIRLQCAKCHNHPFDRWTQDDYHRWAALFARVQYRIVENRRRDRFDKHEFDGEQVVFMDRESEVLSPQTGAVLAPKFLGAGGLTASTPDRLVALADWVARPDNPYFARAQVNRVWYHLLGRGLVEPNDDFRASNPPTNPALMAALTADFVQHRFDLRQLVRRIMNSRTYQLSALPNDTNREDEANFAHAQVRPLQAEQLLDALAQVLDAPVDFPGQPKGVRAGQLPGVGVRKRRQATPEATRFLSVFGKPVRSLSCECERGDDTTLNQAFQLITGEMLNRMLSEPDNRLGKRMAAGRSDEAILEELYLAALCRLPSPAEKAAAKKLLARAKDRRGALEDVAWGLVNAKEFLLRR